MDIICLNNQRVSYGIDEIEMMSAFILSKLGETAMFVNGGIEISDITHDVLESYINNKESECISCGEIYGCGAAGYCAPCWQNVFGCDDTEYHNTDEYYYDYDDDE